MTYHKVFVQYSPSHSHVITLMEHIMEANDALLFHMHMQSLEQKCKFWSDSKLQANPCVPAEPPSSINDDII